MNTETLTREQIEAQITELENKKASLVTEEKYLEIVEQYNKSIEESRDRIIKHNKIKRAIYDSFVLEGGGDFAEIITEHIPLHKEADSNYYTASNWDPTRILVKEEDFNTEIIEEVLLKINGKNIISWNYDKVKDTYSLLASDINYNWQYRFIKIPTLIKKLKEEVEKKNKEKKVEEELKKVCEELKKEFQEKYPESTITSGKEYYKSPHSKIGEYLDIIIIKFPNSNYVKIEYYEDKSWYIHKIYKVPPKVAPTKEEIIEDLR